MCPTISLFSAGLFQWAPTLGGECYGGTCDFPSGGQVRSFNGHPPLGVNATSTRWGDFDIVEYPAGFNGHPPLGVNATRNPLGAPHRLVNQRVFQWAPTLGGECYGVPVQRRRVVARVPFQWAPTLGGECYLISEQELAEFLAQKLVSMGTHPWG